MLYRHTDKNLQKMQDDPKFNNGHSRAVADKFKRTFSKSLRPTTKMTYVQTGRFISRNSRATESTNTQFDSTSWSV